MEREKNPTRENAIVVGRGRREGKVFRLLVAVGPGGSWSRKVRKRGKLWGKNSIGRKNLHEEGFKRCGTPS